MSYEYGILTRIVAERSLAPEPVATSALVHLLQRFSVAADAVARLAAEICPGIPGQGLTWKGQAWSQQDASTPDALAEDPGGARIVLEAKFDAELTPAQLGRAYLDRLSEGAPGLLLYVTPADRIPAVWSKLLQGPARLTPPQVPDPSNARRQWVSQPLRDGRVVAIVSWAVILDRIDVAAKDSADAALMSDLAQLTGLVSWRTRVQWVPIAAGDFDSRIGRQLAGLGECIRRAARNVRGDGVRVEGGGSTDSGPGRWIDLRNGIRIWVGIWPMMWGRQDISPLWLDLNPRYGSLGPPSRLNSDILPKSALEEMMTLVARALGCATYTSDAGWAVPLIPPMWAEQLEVIESLASQIRVAVDVIHAATEGRVTPDA